MKHNTNYIKFLPPFFGILFCPVTILLIWSLWTDQIVKSKSELIEEIQP